VVAVLLRKPWAALEAWYAFAEAELARTRAVVREEFDQRCVAHGLETMEQQDRRGVEIRREVRERFRRLREPAGLR